MTDPIGAPPYAFELRSFPAPEVSAAPPPMRPLNDRDFKWTAPLTQASRELVQFLSTERSNGGRATPAPDRLAASAGVDPVAANYDRILKAHKQSMQDTMQFQLRMHNTNLTVQLALQLQASVQKQINQLLNQQGA